MGKKFISLEQAAKILGVTGNTLRKIRDAGEIPYYRIGQRDKFVEQEINTYMERSRRHGNDTAENSFDAGEPFSV